MTKITNTTDFANNLLNIGVCAVPCKMPEKRPALAEWTKFQKVLPAIGQHQFNGSLGIITGKISGNVFVLDIDTKYDLSGTLLERLENEIGPELWDRVFQAAYIQKTLNNGLHIFLRCEEIEGNQKLASRYTTEKERAKESNEKTKVLLETRSEGGFIVCSPTPGYEVVTGALTEIGFISVDDKERLFEACRSLNEVFDEIKPPTSKKFTSSLPGLPPWEDYNQRADVPSYLQSRGWTYFKKAGKNLHFARPGKKGATSGTYNEELNLFRCFSTSTPLESDKSYSPSALFTYLECGKNFEESARRLRAMNYGDPLLPDRNKKPYARQELGSPDSNLFRLSQKLIIMQQPKKIFAQLWAEGEVAFLFAEDGAGKSILGVQIACAIATGQQIPGFPCEVPAQPVGIMDVELSDFQFYNRYPGVLPDNFYRFAFNEDQQSALVKADLQFVVDQIEKASNTVNAKILILDNLAALTSMIDATKTSEAIQLMGLLNELKKKGFSILIVDHCRKPMKEAEFKTVSKHDLQGSKMKTNLVDSVFSIGKSCQGENYRYIKALKIRSYEMAFTKSAVATMYLKPDPLRLDFLGLDPEWTHVNDRNSQAGKMSSEGKTQAEIARELNITQQAVSKILNN